MLFTLTRGNDNSLDREDERYPGETDTNDAESFDSPVYEPSNSFRPGSVKRNPAYSFPQPVLPQGYVGSPGYGFPYSYNPYSRYGLVPFSYPPAYGAMLSNPSMMCALMSGLGYSCYGGPYSGRSAYPGFPYSFSNYNAAGLNYLLSGTRRSPAPIAGAPVPLVGVPGTPPVVPPIATSVAQPIPDDPYVSRFSNDISGVAAPVARAWASRSTAKGGQTPTLRRLY